MRKSIYGNIGIRKRMIAIRSEQYGENRVHPLLLEPLLFEHIVYFGEAHDVLERLCFSLQVATFKTDDCRQPRRAGPKREPAGRTVCRHHPAAHRLL